ncbi:MAG: transglycosylase domain-containing protein, partial [Gemmatimonadales bacterium]|nr:transglycosylase domain-containing protein [Gemmatimonadales bacterium]
MTLLGGLWLAVWILQPLPHGLLDSSPAPGLLLQDRRGGELRTTRSNDGSRRRWVSLTEMDPDLIAAFLATEDRRFYRHHGVDLRAAVRALATNQRAGRMVSGGSTITMQVARMLRPAARDWGGKLRQVTWALRLERHLDKHAILEQWLNRAYFGNGQVGFDAAARFYFGKSATALSDAEALTLAVIPRAPTGYDPLKHLDATLRRRDYVLQMLVARGAVSTDEAATIRATPLALARHDSINHAPHFVAYAVEQLPADVRAAGGRMHTTLDLQLQRTLQRRVTEQVAQLSHMHLQQAGVIVMDTE